MTENASLFSTVGLWVPVPRRIPNAKSTPSERMALVVFGVDLAMCQAGAEQQAGTGTRLYNRHYNDLIRRCLITPRSEV